MVAKLRVTKKPTAAETCWADYLAFCNKHAGDNRWFRGVSDTAHELIPKVGRGHRETPWATSIKTPSGVINLKKREGRLLEAFKRRARLGLQSIPKTELEWMAIAQHHGVPTRLLDWTTNPLMAAWFAVHGVARPRQVARVYVVRVSPRQLAEPEVEPLDLPGSEPKFVVAPHWHPRVRAQRGCFSIHPIPNTPYEPEKMVSFDIASEHWPEFLRRLFYFGVDASTVMADLPGLGQALAWQYETRIGVGQVGY